MTAPLITDPEQRRKAAMALGLIPDPEKLAAENAELKAAKDTAVAEREAAKRDLAAAREEVARLRASQAAVPAPAAAGVHPDRQWTLDDVKRSTPAETTEALEAGLLRDLGYGPRRRH